MTEELILTPLTNDFIAHLQKQGKTQNTLKNYRTDLDCYKNYLEVNQNRNHVINPELSHVLDYGKFLQLKYNSDNSRRRRVQTLRLFFDFLLIKGLVKENPVRKIPSSPKFVDVPKPITFNEVLKWWRLFKTEHESASPEFETAKLIVRRNQIIFSCIFFGGLKVSDLTKLQVDDINLHENGPRILITHSKRDPYTVELPHYLTELFEQYLTELRRQQIQNSLHFTNVFFNANPYRILSGGLSPRGIEIIFEELRNKIDGSATPKKLRESAICRWINLRKNESTIKEWMGVAPSYSLKRFKDISENFYYGEEALQEILYYKD